MICGIHQPNFFPFVPIMEKIRQSDIFVILVNCQYEKSNYQNRFYINSTHQYYTMPVNKGRLADTIENKTYIDPVHNWNKIKMALIRRYQKLEGKLGLFDSCFTDNSLFRTNIRIISKMCELLNIDVDKIQLDYKTELRGTARLVDICQYYGCDEYIVGKSGINYGEFADFEKAKIKTRLFDYSKVPMVSFMEYYYGI